MYLAIDIGGTKTLVALFSARGRVVRRFKFHTARGAVRFVSDLKKVLSGFSKYRVKSVVVAIPGLVQKITQFRLVIAIGPELIFIRL